MLSLVLVSTLHLAPGVRLIDSAAMHPRIRLVRDDEDQRPSLDTMTREQLVREQRRLEDERPGLGGPIAQMAVGYPLLFGGIGVAFFGVGSLAFATSTGVLVGFALIVVGGAMVTVGFILALVGTIRIFTRVSARSANAEAIDEVQQKIDALDQAPLPGMAPPPPSDVVPPPPPPLPPEASFVRPGPMLTVMTF